MLISIRLAINWILLSVTPTLCLSALSIRASLEVTLLALAHHYNPGGDHSLTILLTYCKLVILLVCVTMTLFFIEVAVIVS